MYKYSPIKRIYIRDFMSIHELEIDFSKSNIVSLYGDNDSGKSAAASAVAVTMAHIFTKEQKDYIKDGTNMFGVSILLEDGTEVIRMKSKGINCYKLVKNGVEVWSTNTLSVGIPQCIQDVMGIIEEKETGELLQYRTCRELLMFVDTSSSTNDKIMNSSLKIDNIAKAIKAGSQELNTYKSEYDSLESSIDSFNHSLAEVKTKDITDLVSVRNRLKDTFECFELLDKVYEELKKKSELKDEIELLKEIDNCEVVNYDTIKLLNNIERISSELKNDSSVLERYSEVDKLETIDIDVLNKLNSILVLKSELDSIRKELNRLSEAVNLEEIDISKIDYLKKVKDNILEFKEILKLKTLYSPLENFEEVKLDIFSILEKVIVLKEEIVSNGNELENINKMLKAAEEELKQSGGKVIVCGNCGNEIVVENQ